MNIKKQIPKLMAVLLSFAMSFNSVIPAYAAEVIISESLLEESDMNETDEEDAVTVEDDIEAQADSDSRYEEIEVNYSQSSNYYVTIPKTITLGTDKRAPYSIKVEGDIVANKQVCVVPVDGIEETEVFDFYMKDQIAGSTKDDVVAEVSQSKFYWNHKEAARGYEETDNYVIAEGLSAGRWKGNFQMEISMRVDPEHIHNYVGEVTKEPTCTEAGEKTYTCDCGESYTETIDPTGYHYKNGECEHCGEKDPNHEHRYTETITKQPTCTEEGEVTYTCNCGDSYTEVIPVMEHHFEDGECTDCGEKDPDYHEHSYKETITKEPTCTETGEKTYTCDCGDSYTEEIDATGHSYVEGECEYCGEEDPDYHRHSYTETITKEPTCTEAGEKTYTCDCGDSYTETIDATGHIYGTDDKCTGCGQLNPEHEHKWVDGICTVCGVNCEHDYIAQPPYQWEETTSGSYQFIQEGNKWTSNNQGIKSSTATTTWNIEIREDTQYVIKYRVSSEETYDKFTLKLDNNTIANTISGDGSEVTYNTTLSAGTHTLTATYSKDSGTNKYDDCGYVVLNPIIIDNHKCSECGLEEVHDYDDTDHCNVCGELNPAHEHEWTVTNDKHTCDLCGKSDEHNYDDMSRCKICGTFKDAEPYLGTIAGKYSSTVKNVIFTNESIDISKDYIDLGAEGYEGSVVGYEKGSTLYVLSVRENAKIKIAQTDDNGIFEGCSTITSINFNNMVNASETISMDEMFKDCSNLKELNLIGLNLNNVETATNCFSGCKLDTISVPKGHKFNDGSELYPRGNSNATVKWFNVNTDEEIESNNLPIDKDGTYSYWMNSDAYLGRLALYIPSTAKSIRFANYSIPTSGTKYDLSLKRDGSVIGFMSGTQLCITTGNSRKKVKIAQYPGQYTGANGTFSHLQNITSITFDANMIDTSEMTDMTNMFWYCSNLTSLDISSWDTSNVVSMYDAFGYCDNMANLYLSGINTSNVENMKGMFEKWNNTVQNNIYGLSDIDTSKVKNFEKMFQYNYFTKLDLSKWDTSSAENMNSMFYYCTNVSTIEGLGNWDVSNVTDMSNMFYNCKVLTALDVSTWNTSNVTDMKNMFYNCSKLTGLDVSSWNTSNTVYMQQMFSGCTSLSSIDVSNWNVSKVEDIRSMFSGYTGKELDFSKWNTDELTNINGFLYNCSNIEYVDVSEFNTSKIEDINSIFRSCSKLKEIHGISNWDVSNVKSMDYTFNSCSNLEVLDLSGWENSLLTKLASTFSACSKLRTLDLSGIDMSNITTVSTTETSTSVSGGLLSTFSGTNLQEIYLGDNNKVGVAGTRNDSGLYPDGNKTGCWIDVDTGKPYVYSALPNAKGHYVSEGSLPYLGALSGKVPDTAKSIEFTNKSPQGVSTVDVSSAQKGSVLGWLEGDVFYIKSNVENEENIRIRRGSIFTDLSKIEEIEFNNLVSTSSATSIYSMFRNCSALKSLDLSDWDVSNVTQMTYAFYGCSALKNIIGTENWTCQITSSNGLESMFYGCTNLEYIDLNNLDISQTKNLNYTFYGCNSLEQLNISNWDTSNVTSMYITFNGCGTQEVIDMVSDWNLSKITTMYNCFGQYKETKATVAFDAPALTNITYLFSESESLQKADLSGITSKVISSMDGIFRNCSNLKSANINFYMGAVQYTNNSQSTCRYVFANCPNLEEIWLSNTNKLYHADVQLYPKGNKNGYWYNVVNGSAYKNTSMSGEVTS